MNTHSATYGRRTAAVVGSGEDREAPSVVTGWQRSTLFSHRQKTSAPKAIHHHIYSIWQDALCQQRRCDFQDGRWRRASTLLTLHEVTQRCKCRKKQERARATDFSYATEREKYEENEKMKRRIHRWIRCEARTCPQASPPGHGLHIHHNKTMPCFFLYRNKSISLWRNPDVIRFIRRMIGSSTEAVHRL